MDNSPLGKLPGELRNNIYELVALKPNTAMRLCISANAAHAHTDDSDLAQTALALAATCEEIRVEVLPLFYGANTFTFTLPGLLIKGTKTRLTRDLITVSRILRWFQDMGERSASLLRTVVVDLDRWSLWHEIGMQQGPHGAEIVNHVMGELERAFELSGAKLELRVKVDWTVMVEEEQAEQLLINLVLPIPMNAQARQTVSQQVEEKRKIWIEKEDCTDLQGCVQFLDEYEGFTGWLFKEWDEVEAGA
jgi:hypothetical protein